MNTSDEVRGLTLREVLDFEFEIQQAPRIFTILFETSDLLGIRQRAIEAEAKVIGPVIGEVPETDRSPRLRFMEFGVVDPDGHVLTFFQNFENDESWETAKRSYRVVAE